MRKRVLILAFGFVDLNAQAGEIHNAVQAGELARVKELVAKDPKAVSEKEGLS
jgi:hypothetical protein